MIVTIVITDTAGHMISCSVVSSLITTVNIIAMDNRNKARHAVTNFQDKFYYDYPSYKKDERRDGRAKLRRSDSSRSRGDVSRTRDKSSDRRQPLPR